MNHAEALAKAETYAAIVLESGWKKNIDSLTAVAGGVVQGPDRKIIAPISRLVAVRSGW